MKGDADSKNNLVGESGLHGIGKVEKCAVSVVVLCIFHPVITATKERW